MYNVFLSRNVLVRISVLWIVGFICMMIAWGISYRALPEGVFHGKVIVSYVRLVTEDLLSTFSRIFTYNLLLACTPLIISNLIKLRTLPLGYILIPYHWSIYGILLGTNSFAFPGPTRLIPTLEILFWGTGMYEITAYTLMVASTYSLSLIWTERTSKQRRQILLRGEKITLGGSIVLLLLANFFEACQIVGYSS